MRRVLSAIVLLVVCQSAWALHFTPATNPSTTGDYTVNFPNRPLGCYDPIDIYYHCYALYESVDGGQSWYYVATAQDQISWQTFDRTAGTYNYMVAHYVNAWGPDNWDEVIESGTMVVQSEMVSFAIDIATGTEGGSVVLTVTKTGSTSQTTGVSYATSNGQATSGTDFTAASGTLSFAWNETAKTFPVNTLQDTTAEYQEFFNVQIHSPTGPATIGTQWGAGYINDDDPVPTISIGDATIGEDGNLSYPVTLSNPAVYSVGANRTFGGTATSGADYDPCCNSVWVNALATSASFVVDTLPDSIFEGSETVTVTLSPLGGVPIGNGFAVGTITDDDTVSFTINDTSTFEGGSLPFTVTQTGASVFTHIVRYDTANGTATTADGDYTAVVNGTLSFPPTSSAQQTLPIGIGTLNESPAKLEAHETVLVNLSDGGLNGATIGDSQGVGTITNNDIVSFNISDVSVSEGGTLAFVVTRGGASDFTHAVNYATGDAMATVADGDYTAASGSVSFPPSGAPATQNVNIATLDETPAKLEPSQTMLVHLSDGGQLNGALIGTSPGIGTITDDDSVSFTISDVSAIEGVPLAFVVTRNGASDFTHTVRFDTADGSATTADGDYTAVTNGSVSFPPSGAAAPTLNASVTTIDEQPDRLEPSQTVLVNLSDGGLNGATIGDSQGSGTITNDDSVTFAINDPSVIEGGNLSFTVTQTGASDFTHVVNFASANNTATVVDGDYTATSGNRSFAPTTSATQAQSVPVTTLDESPTRLEAAQTLFVNLTDGGLNGATIADSSGTGTITDDDTVTLSINDTSIVEGGTLPFTVTQTGGSDFSHSVTYATANNTATTAGGDYTAASSTVNFSPTTSATQTSPVNVVTLDESPAEIEGNETLFVNLSGPTGGATLSDGQGVGTITDDDVASVSFTISDATVTEGGALGFTVTRTGTLSVTHTVQYATANGTATSGSDYEAIGLTTLTFTSGVATQPVSVTTGVDATSEDHETVNVNLSNPSAGGTLADAQGVGTISNDDAPGMPINLTGPIGVSGTSVTLTWTAASGYLTRHDVERTFEGAVTTLDTTSSSTSYPAPLPTTNGIYRFRVRACTSAGGFCGAWSNTHEVVRSASDAATGVPSLISGSDDAGPSTGLTNDFNGIVAGEANVDPSGAASYAIPIAIPPGTRGMQPSLALVYSSHGGTGLVGRGWALAGASSAVTRCEQTIAQDGTVHAVDYTSADRFCLDGQRLVLTTPSTTYGANGAHYRTELETFRDVVSNGGTNSSPNSFTVQTADGRTLSYGGTTGSNFQASVPNLGEVAAWLLRRVEDQFGNYFDITYFEDETNGHYHVQRIDYTGHSTAPVVPTYASVEFTYDAVVNPIKHYRAGSVMSVRQRLRKITAKDGAAAVREYVLAYNENETVPVSGMARLTSIKECAPTEAGPCTAPTTFDWIDEVGGFPYTGQFDVTSGSSQEWVDLNADNRTDFVGFITPDGSQQTVRLSTGTGFSAPQTWTKGSSTNTNYTFADVDGDGDADFVTFNTNIQDQLVSKSNGVNGYESPTVAWAAHALMSGGHIFADMNADGRADFVTWQNTGDPDETINYYVSLSTGSGYSNLTWAGPKLVGTPGWEPTSYDFHDVNSDGRTDLVLVKGITHRIYVNNGSGFDPHFEVAAGPYSEGSWADVNGDSLLDYVTAGSPNQFVSLWTGKSYVNETWTGSNYQSQAVWRDMNGDGLSDFLGGGPPGFSTGNGYVTAPLCPCLPGNQGDFPDFDGDGKPDFKAWFSPTVAYHINESQPVHLMRKVTDGLGMETVFTYKPLSDPSVYTKLTNATYPIADLVNAVHVVSHVAQSSASSQGDGYFDADYRYTGFKADKTGRGSLGFASVTAEDLDRKIRTVTTYSQTHPTTGLATAIDVTVTDKLDDGTNQAQVISETDNVYAVRAGVMNYGGPAVSYVCSDTSTTAEFDVETGVALRTTQRDNSPGGTVPCDAQGHPGQAGTADAFGTPLTRSVSVTDHVANPDVVHRKDAVTYFNEVFVAGLPNLPTREITKPFVDGVGDSTKDRTSAITYVPGKGVVGTINREPDQAAPIRLLVTFGYDDFGNRTTETLTPSETGGTPTPPLARTETVQFDSAGRFPDLLTNALNQITDVGVDARFGTIATIDGPNATNGAFNDLTTRTFDAFGRVKDERRPDGSYQVVYFKRVEGSASGIADRPQAKIMVETAMQNTAWGVAPATRLTPVRTFLDGLGRELRTRSRAFDATNFVQIDTFYDARGRVEKASEPYYEGQTPTWNTPAYDVVNRAVDVTAADATQSTTTDYNAFTVTTIDAGGRQNRLIADALGRAIRAENLNASGVVLAVTQYLYDKAGNLEYVQKRTAGDTLIANTVITNTFDRLGRRITTTDPDFGAGANGRVDFYFDSMSDLRRQQTPRLRAQSATLYTEFDYDQLARLTYRRDPSTNLTQTVTSTFTFDQVPALPDDCRAGIGHLTTEAISGGGEPGLTTTYCYSPAQLGRLANEQRTTGGVTYRTDFTYDVLGRLSQVRYPVSSAAYPGRYAVNYWYTPRGHLERVQEAQGTNPVLYQTTGANARGQIEKAYLGDGSRTTRGFVKNTERLVLTNAASGASQVQNFVYSYDGVGNISGRADLLNNVSETFGYDSLDRLTTSTVTNGTGPHPVTYAYDDAAGNLGNMTHKSDISTLPSASMSYSTTARPHALTTLNTTASTTRTFAYNANGAITGGQVASGTRTLAYTSYDLLASATLSNASRTFSYGPDRNRYRQVSVTGTTTRTYTYIGEHYVKEVVGSATEHKLYIMANGEPIAYVSDDGTPQTRYLHKDHLGSITTIVTNQNISGREKLSYDAWGRRRHGTDWWSTAATATEERGYTGHEHLDNVTLIHMNGRAYDPRLARMTSPDPFVPAPLFSQSYNRYAYVYNNPLTYTDPSGFGPSDECPRILVTCGGPGPSFWPRLSLPYVPDDGFDWVNASDWALYFQLQAMQDAQQQAPPPNTSTTTGDSPVKTDEGGIKPIVSLRTSLVGGDWVCPMYGSMGCFDGSKTSPEEIAAQGRRNGEIGARMLYVVFVPDFRCIFVGDNCSGLGRAWEVVSVLPVMKITKIGKVADAATDIERVDDVAETRKLDNLDTAVGSPNSGGSRRPSADTRRQADEAATDADGNLRCQYCGDKLTTEPGFPNSREYDHVDPWVRSRDSGPGNIVDSCRTCNRSKGARTPEEWIGPE